MKKLIVIAMVVAMMAMSGVAIADTATSNIQATANVANVCRVTGATDIAFGAYDPTDTSDLDAAGDFTFRCTKGTDYRLYITGTRQMTDGTDNLSFEIYSNPGRTTVYPSDFAGGITGTSSNNSPNTQSLYGRITAGQDVQAGNYSRTLVVTVEY
jgi:spore coat protein U-like protein